MTPRQAMCAFLGCDSLRDMEDSYRYQPKPRERFPLYSVDEYTFTYGPTVPDVPGKWEQDPDQFHALQAGTIIWRRHISGE